MKFGIVGIGRWGKNYIRTIKGMQCSEVVACCSRTPESYNLLPPELSTGLFWTDKVENLLKLDIDTLIISTHPDSHFKYAEMAINAGKDVICEKPCMFTPEQFERISLACKKNGKSFFTDYINSYSSVYPKIFDIINRNDFTELDLMNVGCGPNRDYSSLWDYGSHEVAFAYTVNNCEKGILKKFHGLDNKYYLELEFPKSVANIVTGSGYNGRLNLKNARSKTEHVSWVDERKEPLLTKVLESFVDMPKSNLHVSEYVSSILSQI